MVGGDEGAEVLAELVVAIVMIAFDGGLLDGSVHPLDLPIGPRVLHLGQTMLDPVLVADAIEDVMECVFVPRLVGELDAPFDCLPAAVAQDRIIGEDGVDGVRHRCD